MIVRNITIKNKTALTLLNQTLSKDFINGEGSFAKGFEIQDYDYALNLATSNETLAKHLKFKTPILKLKFNKILGDTEAGKYFSEEMKNLLDYDSFYTSGYIPRGFDRWHSDSDVTGYAMLFSYSEKGDGYFKYRDPITNDINTIQDDIGWMVRGMYYGNKPETTLWHCVVSNCFRVTFILTFDTEDKYNKAVELLTRV